MIDGDNTIAVGGIHVRLQGVAAPEVVDPRAIGEQVSYLGYRCPGEPNGKADGAPLQPLHGVLC